MTTARALVLEAPGVLEERELPVPALRDDDGLLMVEACGVCGTDHEQFSGLLPSPGPVVPGHETVGTVTHLGRSAARRWGVTEGDRVALEVFQSCRSCPACARGEYRRCRRHGMADMYGFVTVDRPPGLWGGYAQYQYLAPDSMLLRVPDTLDAVTASAFNPLGAGFRWGVTVPATKEGDVVAVLGCGIRGLSVSAAVKEAGAGFVMLTGKGAVDQTRLSLAPRFGADVAVDVTQDDPTTTLIEQVNELADVVVDVTAGAPEALAQAVSLARPGGTVVLAGTRGKGATPGFDPDLVVYKELRLLGALGVDVEAYRLALDVLAEGRYPFSELPRQVVPLDPLRVGRLLTTMSGRSMPASADIGQAPRPETERPVRGVVDPWR